MTGNPHQPSGLSRGINVIIDAGWTPDQAAAVFELVEDLREAIWNRYAPDIQDFVRQQRADGRQDHPQKPR